jgi:hypothetical protein
MLGWKVLSYYGVTVSRRLCAQVAGRAGVRKCEVIDRVRGEVRGVVLLLPVGFEKGIKDCTGKDILAVI